METEMDTRRIVIVSFWVQSDLEFYLIQSKKKNETTSQTYYNKSTEGYTYPHWKKKGDLRRKKDTTNKLFNMHNFRKKIKSNIGKKAMNPTKTH